MKRANSDTPRDRSIERLLGAAAEARPARGACLDVEALAAWADDDLAADERAAAEAHAADCARCQALIAAMVTTSVSPAEPAWWRRRAALGWLVPLAAAAAALVIWVAVPGERQGAVDRVSLADSKEPQAEKAPAPPASAPATVGSVPQSVLQRERRAAPSASSDEARQRRADKLDALVGRPPAASARAVEERQPQAFGARASANEAEGTRPSPPAPMAKSMMKRAGAPVEIVSSNPGSRWRIEADGTVLRSMDGGSTWQRQQTGVIGPLTAGASPSPSVCWLVGPTGMVLLSTDGRSWRRVAFPDMADLTSVTATDDKTATVTTADGRSFSTADGGQTWARADMGSWARADMGSESTPTPGARGQSRLRPHAARFSGGSVLSL